MRLLSALLFCAVLQTALWISQAEASAAERPNVLVILCDDLGYGDLECYGHPHIKTPNLNRLAEQGIRLTACYSAAPVCSSSRAGLLTGQTPNRVGIYDWIPPNHVMQLKAETPTVAKQLKQAGYSTAVVGKWHCNGKFNSPEQAQPSDNGFDHWYATQNNASPRHENPVNFIANGDPVGPLEGFSCQLVTDEAIRWLKDRPSDKAAPFFLHVCFHEPHEPVESPDDLVAQYRDVARDEDEAQYFANVANVDLAVGRLMAALDDMQLADNTLVYFTSDNGPETLDRYRTANRSYGSPGEMRGMKLHIYEGGIRVAGIVRWPAVVEAGQISTVPVCSLDLFPTLSNLAGVDVPEAHTLDGVDITAFLKGDEFKREKPLFWNYYRALSPPRVALRDGDWKIVAHWDGPTMDGEGRKVLGSNVNPSSQHAIKTAQLTRFELYNLAKDPSETEDLAKAKPKVLDRMKKLVLDQYREVQQQSPEWKFEAAKK